MKKKDYTVPVIVIVGLFVLTLMLNATIVGVVPELSSGTIKLKHKPANIAPVSYQGREHIEVIDQTVAGNAMILSVALKENGYVVIHKEEKGKPGKIIGVSPMLAPGLYSNRLVPLTETVAPGEGLIAMLHADNGDGVFSALNDAPVKGDEMMMMGGSGMMSFMNI